MMSVERAAAANTLKAYEKDLADARGFLAARGSSLARPGPRPSRPISPTSGRAACRPPPPPAAAPRCASSIASCSARAGGPDDPSRRVAAPKQGRPLPKVLSREEMDRLIAAAGGRGRRSGPAHGRLVELAYASGLRVSELVGLPYAAMARDPAYLMVKGKGGKERLAPLNDAARTAVKAYLEVRKRFLPKGAKDSPWLFPLARGQRPADRPPLRPAPGGRRRRRRGRPRQGQPPRAAPRLRHPPAGRRRRPSGGADPARPRRHRHHPDLHPRHRRAAARRGREQAPAGAQGRAVLLRLVWRAFGPWVAFAVSAALFGFGHIGNPNATVFAAIAIALEAGIMLGAFYALTGRLWMSIGVHAAWNFTQGYVFGAAVSGGNFGPAMANSVARPGKPEWLTGGPFGPEASAPALIVCMIVGLVVTWMAWRAGQFAKKV
jgi:integrase